MSTRRITLSAAILAGCLALSLGSTVARAELLTNPGFETGDFSGWTVSGDIAAFVSPGDAHSGNFAAFFEAVGDLTFISQTVNSVAGETLDISAFIANLGGTPNEFQILLNGTPLLDLVDLPQQDYAQESVTGTAIGNDVITFGFRQDPTAFVFDDASVTVASVPEPMSIALLGAGLVGFGLLRRRKSEQ